MAALVALGVTPLAGRLATRVGVVDRPHPRKLHLEPIPLLGGLAIYVALILALLLFSEQGFIAELASILVGASLVSFLGVWDDRWGLRPLLKLGGQALAASLLFAFGVQVAVMNNTVLNYLVTVMWVLGITNALNLLDNMDGLSGGIAAVAAGFFLLLAALNGQYLVGSLAAALTGACLGFLRYNFNPARIFMGDAGSLFLGFLLAAVGIKLRFPAHPVIITWMIPVIVLGLPIFDTVLVIISRLRRGINPLTNPGQDHVSHRLVRLGLSQREAVMLLYILSGSLGMMGILLTLMGVVEAYLIAGLLILAALIALIRLERVPLPR